MRKFLQEKIKTLRKTKKLTIEQLANKAGCTKSYISQLEKGINVPSVSMLGRLAEALDSQVGDFFRNEDMEPKKNWKLCKADRRSINYPDEKVTSQLLTRAIFQKKMQPLISIIEPGGTSDDSDKLLHPEESEEFVLVLKGEIDFEINLDHIKLKEGDTLYFNGNQPHSWMNEGKETAEVLFVWTPPVW